MTNKVSNGSPNEAPAVRKRSLESEDDGTKRVKQANTTESQAETFLASVKTAVDILRPLYQDNLSAQLARPGGGVNIGDVCDDANNIPTEVGLNLLEYAADDPERDCLTAEGEFFLSNDLFFEYTLGALFQRNGLDYPALLTLQENQVSAQVSRKEEKGEGAVPLPRQILSLFLSPEQLLTLDKLVQTDKTAYGEHLFSTKKRPYSQRFDWWNLSKNQEKMLS